MININNLHFSYTRNKRLFQGLDLELAEGKVYGLLGKNGTGKSSLLKLMVGVLDPKEGEVLINDTASFKRDPEILSDIFFLSEDYELPSLSISKYLKANAAFYPKFDENKFNECLEIFEIDRDSIVDKLSYGQKKKVLISFGVASNTKYLLLDEPTNGLDIPSKSQFRKVLISGFRDDQIVVISTHQIRDLNQLLESVIIIEEGKIIFNKELMELEDQLLFSKSINESEYDDAVYSESMPGGYVHIRKNETNEPSEVELEVLFNAVIKDRNNIYQLFN